MVACSQGYVVVRPHAPVWVFKCGAQPATHAGRSNQHRGSHTAMQQYHEAACGGEQLSGSGVVSVVGTCA
jgi:hypothetical protein